MKIEKLTEIIQSTSPCSSGWKWYLHLSKDCKTSTEFFNKCKKIVKVDPNAYSPHGYLRYIFYKCLDWTEIAGVECLLQGEYNAGEFLYNNFNTYSYLSIPIPELCDALKRAFK